ncbi:MAG TPA: tetratricopeptide repeat protein, partial [Herpetosiphonaceae bacterium]
LERAVEQDSRAYANRSALDRCRRLIGLLRAGEATDPAAAPKLVRALISQSNLGVRLADWPAARAAAEEALGLAIRLGDTAACVEIWGLLGEIARNSNDHQQALEYYGLALDYYESRGDQLNAARTLNRMALNQQDQGAYDEAMRSFERALALNQAVGDQDVLAHILNNKGLLHWRQSDYRAANACYREALRISQARGDLQRAASVIGNLGLLRWHEGDLDEALECYQQAHALHERLGNRAGMATSLGNQALLYAERCDYEQAVAIYRRAIDGDRELGNEAGLARHLGNLGLIFGNQGRFDEALTHHQQALEIDQRLGKRADVARHMGNLAEIWRHKGEFAQALALYDQTVPLLRELGATYYLCWQLIQQAETLLLCGRPAEAAPLNAEGLALALKAGDPSDVFQGQLLAAQLLAAGGEPERARQRLETLLAGREEARERAVLFHALWRLGGEEGHRQQAIRLYRGAYAEMPNVLDGRRLEELLAGGWTEPWPAPAAAHSGTMEP